MNKAISVYFRNIQYSIVNTYLRCMYIRHLNANNKVSEKYFDYTVLTQKQQICIDKNKFRWIHIYGAFSIWIWCILCTPFTTLFDKRVSYICVHRAILNAKVFFHLWIWKCQVSRNALIEKVAEHEPTEYAVKLKKEKSSIRSWNLYFLFMWGMFASLKVERKVQ